MHPYLCSKPELIEKRESIQLEPFLERYFKIRSADVKPRTLMKYRSTIRYVYDYFSETKLLIDITPGDADECRLIFAQARYVGLRTPSEMFALR
ncbi:MAG: hypothetical protein K0U86_07250 [Planctomycetes bacterium]|nr:hypothetical protein [Planctomycetota bacterium]MCH9724685.1 hypothetical protein [Planctomycetota bacterium]MCH9774836.1 hypothetical protein [Planctomycetota bacterium]